METIVRFHFSIEEEVLMEDAIDILWQQYRAEQSPHLKQRLILNYLGLVRYVMKRFRFHGSGNGRLLSPSDIFQFGILGLIDAVDRYRPSMGVKFETFAIPRIKGTIQDQLRKLDWVPRSVRRRAREAHRFTLEVERASSSGLVSHKVAEKLTLSCDEYQEILQEAGGFSMDTTNLHQAQSDLIENIAVDESADPLEALSTAEVRTLLIDLVDRLPQREKLIVALHYYERLTFKEIARILQLSESRVFQIHTEVLNSLRRKLELVL